MDLPGLGVYGRFMNGINRRQDVHEANAAGRGASGEEHILIVVQRDWNGWRTATARLSDLDEVHWSQPVGAVRPLIRARVKCDRIVSGEIAHDCGHSPVPHDISVWVLKSHTTAPVFEELSRRADQHAAEAAPVVP
jgi:hypothetical protein